jgi:formate--tetrahydrofolate ligase
MAMRPIADIAGRLGLTEDLIEPYGRYTAKIRLETLQRFPQRRGKLILVTAITPTTSGEGKTVNTIGLTQGLVKRGHHAVAALREPSLGPVFGQKGGATGGGLASLAPVDKINLHFNGDFHAITAAHNLLAALLDTHLHFGNELRLDPREILWPRAMDMNDRALRRIITGVGGRDGGPDPRDRLCHHRRLRDHGDSRPGREPRRPAAPPRRNRGRLQRRGHAPSSPAI